MVKLTVDPFYGWGWFDDHGSIDVPPQFELDAEIIEPGETFKAVLGQLPRGSHPLAGMWILLSQRHVLHDGQCNLYAFTERPKITSTAEPIPTKQALSGFASAVLI